jgi:hypothetical protein
MPVILATQEAGSRGMVVGSQARQNSSREPISKIYKTKIRAGGVAQVSGRA